MHVRLQLKQKFIELAISDSIKPPFLSYGCSFKQEFPVEQVDWFGFVSSAAHGRPLHVFRPSDVKIAMFLHYY